MIYVYIFLFVLNFSPIFSAKGQLSDRDIERLKKDRAALSRETKLPSSEAREREKKRRGQEGSVPKTFGVAPSNIRAATDQDEAEQRKQEEQQQRRGQEDSTVGSPDNTSEEEGSVPQTFGVAPSNIRAATGQDEAEQEDSTSSGIDLDFDPASLGGYSPLSDDTSSGINLDFDPASLGGYSPLSDDTSQEEDSTSSATGQNKKEELCKELIGDSAIDKKTTVQSLNTAIRTLEQRIEEETNNKNSLQTKIRTLEISIAEKKADPKSIETPKTELKKSKDIINCLRDDLEEAQEKLKGKDKKEELCKKLIGDSKIDKKDTVKSLNTAIRKLERRFQEETDNKDSLQKKIRSFEILIETKEVEPTSTDIPEENLKTSKDIINCLRDDIEEAQEKLEDVEECETEYEDLQEKHSEFQQECNEFASGIKCSTALRACEKCPSNAMFPGYNCVTLHNNSQCPEFSGEALEAAEEQRDTTEEEKKDLQEKIEEQEQNLLDAETELKEQLAELEDDFSKLKNELEATTEEQKIQLEQNLQKEKGQVSQAISASIAKVQKKLAESLQKIHDFENAITKNNIEYRAQRLKIIAECETQARGRLAEYRKKRKTAIRNGTYRISLYSLMQKGRQTFAQKDTAKFNIYYAQCIKLRKEALKMIDTEYQVKMRQVEQAQERYQEEIKKLRALLTSLNQQASQARLASIKRYTENMDKLFASHQKNYNLAVQEYMKAKAQIMEGGKQLTLLQKQLMQSQHLMKEKHMASLREAELIGYLKSKGVTTEESGATDQFAEARAALIDFDTAMSVVRHQCKDTEIMESDEFKKMEKNLEDAKGKEDDGDDDDNDDDDNDDENWEDDDDDGGGDSEGASGQH